MPLHLEDTIVALSSAAGPGGRAIIRLSGPNALTIARTVFLEEIENHRGITSGNLRLSNLAPTLPAELYLFPAPHSVSGQTVVELHFISSPPLVDLLLSDLMKAGARAARPGEFTLRGFLAGKIDLPRAEAILGVIESTDRDELKRSLRQLAGGVSQPLTGLREDLLNLLADLEAGLDFVEEDIEFVERPDLLNRLARGLAQLSLVKKQVEDRGVAGREFRVVLAGPPNAGKSRLFNALTGGEALVSPIPGTTRDYLTARLDLNGIIVLLIDTAGLRATNDELEAQAHALAHNELLQSDLIVVCVPPESDEFELPIVAPSAIRIITKSDLRTDESEYLATSAVTGAGLNELRVLLAERAASFAGKGLAPSLSRCRHHVEACLNQLRSAHQGVLFGDPPEIVALALRDALEHLGAMTGEIHTDDLLDRIFSRFCIGK